MHQYLLLGFNSYASVTGEVVKPQFFKKLLKFKTSKVIICCQFIYWLKLFGFMSSFIYLLIFVGEIIHKIWIIKFIKIFVNKIHVSINLVTILTFIYMCIGIYTYMWLITQVCIFTYAFHLGCDSNYKPSIPLKYGQRNYPLNLLTSNILCEFIHIRLVAIQKSKYASSLNRVIQEYKYKEKYKAFSIGYRAYVCM